ncbi:hypothetical protein NQT62_06855 [Limnobacter humi]|uniref:Uncharacterized protein n=1 Tax=Limnobacter humi TaxID=1778671 RepID=A0ABT1WF69_9BURK|nr:hypothetical protein [Limnobacter humi]MCQ8896156.1 hypothetical protein [Limnobacter humi]
MTPLDVLRPLGVMGAGLGGANPQTNAFDDAFLKWLALHLIEGKFQLFPGLTLVYVPERFELQAYGLNIPLDTADCSILNTPGVKFMASSSARLTESYLRLGNIHLAFTPRFDFANLTHFIRTFTLDMQGQAQRALQERLELLEKKQSQLADRAPTLAWSNWHAIELCKAALKNTQHTGF